MCTTRDLRLLLACLLLVAGWLGCSSSDNSPSGPDLGIGSGEVQILSATSDYQRGGWVTVVWTRYGFTEDFIAYAVERSVGDSLEIVARMARDDTVFVDRSVLPGKIHGYRVSTETAGTVAWSEEAQVRVLEPPDGVVQRVGSFEIKDPAGLEALAAGDDPFEVRGDLIIRSTDLTSLSTLSNLVAVHGNLRISGNQELTELGLMNLEIVSGSLSVGSNPALPSLDGLRALRHVGGGLGLSALPGVTSLEPLRQLQSIGGLSLTDNESLTRLQPLAHLLPELERNLGIRNPGLTDALDVLAGVRHVGGFLSLRGADLSDLAMPNLERVGGLSIGETGMADLSAFSSLQRIDGPLQVKDSDLVSLVGIEDVKGVTGIELVSNRALTDLTALSGLQTLETLWIAQNTAMTSLEGLHNVSRVDGPNDGSLLHLSEVVIQSNTALADLDGLSGLRQVSRSLLVTNNSALTDAGGLAAVEQIGHTLWIIGNPNLRTVDLSSLSSVVEVLEISDNPVLAFLDLADLAEVGFLLIMENSSLPTRLADAVATSMRAAGLADEKIVVFDNLPDPVPDE